MAFDPRREAQRWLDSAYEARVLEPSPPASAEPPWYADDPVLPGSARARPVVTPVDGLGARSWDQLCRERGDEALATFCADRWLGAWHGLGPLPASFAETRTSLHSLAEHVLAPARHAANGKIGLRFTRRGFGTPFYGADRQLRLESGRLVVVDSRDETRHPVTTIGAAARLAGITPGVPRGLYPPATPGDPDAPLTVDETASEALGAWFGFAWSVLEQLRLDHQPPSDPASARDPATTAPARTTAQATPRPRVQLWPEHFDASIELGDEAAGERATFGASPGDDTHPEPYLYVSPWVERVGAFWSDESFRGASLPYASLLGQDDQRTIALAFFGAALAELTGPAAQGEAQRG